MLKNSEIKEFQLFAERTVKNAGEIVKSFKESYHIKKTKDVLSLDIATDADYASETYIIEQIRNSYPGHSILTEETPDLLQKSDFEWIIDPLDGTKEFIRHIPYYYVLVALEYKHELIGGFAYQPELKRLFSCVKGAFPELNGIKIQPSSEGNLSQSFISMALPKSMMKEKELAGYLALMKVLTPSSYKIRSTAWDVEGLFNVAMGAMEGHIVPNSVTAPFYKWFDVAPGILGVLCAGGKITDFYGKPIDRDNLTQGLVASNGKIHAVLLDLISKTYLKYLA